MFVVKFPPKCRGLSTVLSMMRERLARYGPFDQHFQGLHTPDYMGNSAYPHMPDRRSRSFVRQHTPDRPSRSFVRLHTPDRRSRSFVRPHTPDCRSRSFVRLLNEHSVPRHSLQNALK